ncbi:MAG: SET domain-containing protein [Patescibacteria group bacterium]
MNKHNFSWVHDDIEARESPGINKGLFAKKPIKKGTLVTIFGGYIMTTQEEEKLPEPLNDYGHMIHPDFVMGIWGKDEIEDADFYNHSCNPNVGFKGQIFLYTMRDIEEGESMTFDYAMVLSEMKDRPYQFDCLCGSPDCRGKVTTEDWKIPELQTRYEGYFQWYLEEKIKKIKEEPEQ